MRTKIKHALIWAALIIGVSSAVIMSYYAQYYLFQHFMHRTECHVSEIRY